MLEGLGAKKVASFRLGGKLIELSPSAMRRSADSYSLDAGGGLVAILNYERIAYRFTKWTVILRNEGTEKTPQITDFFGIDLEFPVEGDAAWESIRGDVCGAESFLPERIELPDGAVIEKEACGGRSSQGDAFPYFDLETAHGCATFAVGWTGQWKYAVRRECGTVTVKAGFEDCDFYLAPGEEARSVGAIVATGDTLTATRQHFRRVFRETCSPAAKTGGELAIPFSLQLFDRYWQTRPEWATEEGQLYCIDCAGDMGKLDTYWLDAAWFKGGFPFGVGNYEIKSTFPRGLLPLSEEAHRRGMKFMLWFEPERNDRDSDTAREHPEFMLPTDDPNNRNLLFDLSNEDAFEWLRGTLCRMIRENGIDVYRQDFNTDPLGFWRRCDAPDRRGYTENRYITNLYRLWDALLAEFPGLLIDNCSSGGRRLDFEMNSRSVPMWRSDTGSSPSSDERPSALWNQNQTLGLTRYLPYHATATWTTDAYSFRSAATMGLAVNVDVLGEGFDDAALIAPIRESVALREIWDGDFYPLTEATLSDDVWAAYQLDRGGEYGFCAFFRRKNAPPTRTFALNAIEGDAEYEVMLTDGDYRTERRTVRGAALWEFTVQIAEANGSMILRYMRYDE